MINFSSLKRHPFVVSFLFHVGLIILLLTISSVLKMVNRADLSPISFDLLQRASAANQGERKVLSKISNLAQSQATDSMSSEDFNSKNTEDTNSVEVLTEPSTFEVMPSDLTLLENLKPQYPLKAKLAGVQGDVLLELFINAQGLVSNVIILKTPGFDLELAALDVAKQLKFTGKALTQAKTEGLKVRYLVKFSLIN